MANPTRITDFSTTAANNVPTGGETVGTNADDLLRAIQATVRVDLASKGADIASATTTDLGAIPGFFHDITGTTTITGFGTIAAGVHKVVKFEGALTLTHNATSLILPGGINITTADGDIAELVSEGSGNWRCTQYFQTAVGAYVNINGFTEDTTPDVTADFVHTYDASAARSKKVLVKNTMSSPVVSKKTLTGASIQFTSADFDWTAHDYYEFAIYQAVPATNGAGINVTVSEDAGSTYLASTHYSRAFLALDSGGTARNVSAQGEALWQFPEVAVAGISNSTTNNGFNGVLTLWKPSAALRHQASLANGAYFPGATTNIATISGAFVVVGTPAALTGIKFAPSTGNWTSGTITVSGRRTA